MALHVYDIDRKANVRNIAIVILEMGNGRQGIRVGENKATWSLLPLQIPALAAATTPVAARRRRCPSVFPFVSLHVNARIPANQAALRSA